MPLASTVMDEAASLLNDTAKELYSYTVQIPYLKSAWNKLQLYLHANGIPVMEEESAAIAVAADATLITLPSDFLQPIKVEERKAGTTDLYKEVFEKSDIPEMDQIDNIQYWKWREETLVINSPRLAREVKLTYWKSLNPMTGSGSNLNVLNSLEYLACKTAALCARNIGENPTRSAELESDAEEAKGLVLNIEVKRMQGLPSRPRGYGSRRITTPMLIIRD